MTRKRKKTTRPKRRIKRLIFISILILILIAIIAVALYMAIVSKQIDRRFSGRRWDIPSRVYSDTTLLYAGQEINRDLLTQKLGRLGYRDINRDPEQQGEMSISPESIILYLHDFHSPTFDQEGRPVSIRFRENRIRSMKDLETNTSIALLELEPEELTLYYGPDRERRRYLSVGKLPPHVIHAMLAAEDRDFYKHQGISLKGILRAVIQNLRAGKIRQGASTITQQVARMYFLNQEITYSRKIKEQIIALVLELKFNKTDILEIFLNESYWGQRGSASVIGLAEAARFYFDKEASELSVAEAATLAVIIRNPSYYSPYKNPTLLLERRNTVLSGMREEGWLREDAHAAALETPLNPVGYTANIRQAPYFTDYLTDQLSELYSSETLTTEGLSIFTTIDTQVQQAAEEALSRGLARLESANPKLQKNDGKLQGAIVVMQPKTGYILAMVGGRDYGTSQYNRAANALRQPGSIFKPFVYVTALDTHTPLSKLSNIPQTYMIDGKPWTPKNFEANAPAEITLREALAKSQNIATVNLAFAADFAENPDITSVNLASSEGLTRLEKTVEAFHLSSTQPPYPSLVLGAREVTPLMLARAYCTFAADGVLPFPLSVKDVVDETGTVVESRHARIERLISPAKAYLMSDLLRSAVETGTGRSLKLLGVDWPVAGKTGTTNDSRDAWFVGYTPDILAVVWVGFDNNDSIQATGGRAALPIWADLMNSLPRYVSGEWFDMPSGVEKHTICLDSGLLANLDHCPYTAEELFLSGTEPTETCGMHTDSSSFFNFMEGVKKIVPGF
jgi:penicillin-binding protein 1B